MKKALSVILSIVMIITIMPKLSTDVSAAGYNAQTVVNVALSYVGRTDQGTGVCLAFVKNMFKQAYGFESTAPCAYEYGSKFIDSTSRDNIPLGADVFFSGGSLSNPIRCSCGNIAGHVGIYVGDGYIVHLWAGKVVKTTIDYVVNTKGYNYRYRGWGFHADVRLNATAAGVSENPDDYPIPTRNIYYTSPTMKGDDVRWVQAVLRKLGYTQYCTQVDGSFGIGTRDDLRCFQYDHGLTVDCSVGPDTRKLLKELWEEKKQSEIKLTAISIASMPQKTVYYIGDALDTSGLTITATYSNGSTKKVADGFTVSGFNSTSAGTKTITVSFGGKTSSFTVTVKEKPAPQTYTVAYNANGGTGSMSNTSMTVGTAKNLTANAFTRSGYTFLGWSTDKNATTATYADKQSVKDLATSGTVTLYAVWQKNASSTAPALSVTGVYGTIGQKLKISVNLNNASVGALDFDLVYDPKVLKYTGLSSVFAINDCNEVSEGTVMVVGSSTSSEYTGKVVDIEFDVLATSETTTSITITPTNALKADGETEVDLKEVTAAVTISNSVKMGDINGDDKINSTDAMWVLQAAVKKRTLDGSQLVAADVNHDGKINSTDAMWILQAAVKKRTLS